MAEIADGFLEKIAAVLIGGEEIEACATRRKQHRVALGREFPAGSHGVFEGLGVGNAAYVGREEIEQLLIILPHADYCLDFFLHQRKNLGVVVAFVFSAENKND